MGDPSRYFPPSTGPWVPPPPPKRDTRDRRAPLPVVHIALGGGTLSAGGLPNPRDWMRADVVVTLLRGGEWGRAIGREVRQRGKVWHHVPCNTHAYVARGRRRDYEPMLRAARLVVTALAAGQWVHVHCLEGRHRTRAVLYLVARLLAQTHVRACATVRALRPWTVDTRWTQVLTRLRAHYEREGEP